MTEGSPKGGLQNPAYRAAVFFLINILIMTEKNFFSDEQLNLARFAKALAHPVRVYVLQLLARQSCCYSGDLSEELPIAKSTLSQHLKELKNAGLIQGQIEPPKIKYCLDRKNWEKAKKSMANLFSR